MRIAVLTNAFPPDARGGAGRIAGMYVELLKRHGYEVRVWGPKTSFAKLASMNVVHRLFFHLFDLQKDRPTVERIVSWKPDVLLTHNLTGCGFGTPRAIRSRGTRWVHVLHDVQLIEPSGAIIAGESIPIVRAIWRWKWSLIRHFATGEPDAVASPTEWLLQFHRSFGWFKSCQTNVIPNPILLVTGSCSASDGSPGNVRSILFVGRLDWDKGIDLLIDAWKSLRDVASKLVLIGDGRWKEKINQLGDPSIEVRGQQTAEQVLQAMCGCSVVVVPSRVLENQPTVILEAASADCRIVATDVGGVRETVDGAGTVVPPNDVSSLSSAVRQALVDPITEAEQAARRRLVERHDPERAVGALIGLLTSNL